MQTTALPAQFGLHPAGVVTRSRSLVRTFHGAVFEFLRNGAMDAIEDNTPAVLPHQARRNSWKLAQYVDPVQLRMEILNPNRNAALYQDDPLAPARYEPACLFATTIFGSLLGWFENSWLSPAFVADAAPLIAELNGYAEWTAPCGLFAAGNYRVQVLGEEGA